MQSRWLLGCGLVAGLAGCGLGVDGFEFGHGRADGGAASDASPGTSPGTDLDAGSADLDSTPGSHDSAPQAPCTDGIPQGWSLTLYGTGSTTCPGGTPATHDGVAGGDAGAGACSCSCSVTGPVTCETGTLQIAAGSSSAVCNGSPMSVSVDSDFCAPLPAARTLADYVAVAALPPSGACAASVTTDATKLAKNDVRWCDVGDAGAEAVCAGSAPTGFTSCIGHAGAVSCPSGSAFTKRTMVSDGVSLSCSACSTCELTGTCGAATVAFFSDGNCNNPIIAVNADGKCNLTASPNVPFSSVLYNGALLDAGGCAANGSTPTVSPTGAATTLCCR